MNERFIGIVLYFFSFSWGIAIVLSLVGWGSALNRAMFPNQQADWGQRACWGIAFSILIGGILNLTGAISKNVILLYLSAGLFLWLLYAFQSRRSMTSSVSQFKNECQRDKLILIGCILVFAILLLRYSGSIAASRFNPHDDYHGYFVFPVRMLEAGSLGIDPFMWRSLSALGGQSFLDTFVLCVFSEKNLNMIDAGAGLIIAIAVFWGLFKREVKLPTRQSILLLLLFLVLKTGKFNISSVIIAMALFVSLYRMLVFWKDDNGHFFAKSLVIALLVSAICALKSNLIIACVLLFGLTYILEMISSGFNKKIILEFFSAALFSFLFLFPWMLSLYKSSGTFLYPFLGKGFVANYPSPISELTFLMALKILWQAFTSFDSLCLILLSFVILRSRAKKVLSAGSILPLIISAALGIILLSLAVAGHNVARYGFSQRYAVAFAYPAIICLMALALKRAGEENQTNASNPIIITAFVAGILFAGLSDNSLIQANLSNLRLGLSRFSLVSQQEVSQYAKMQAAVPKGEMILTRLEKPFLLDFKRNKIFIADVPGASSLPPGMPSFKGSEALADYLTSKSIRYIAYSYTKEAGFSKKEFGWTLIPEQSSVLYLIEGRYTFDFQDNLNELGKSRKRIYDDGEIFVIDLLVKKD